MKLVERAELLRREPLLLRPERRLQPFDQAGRAIMVAHAIKSIGHRQTPVVTGAISNLKPDI
jgi:hypothetical protein